MPIENPTFEAAKPQFNALNGEELRHLILRELDQKLSAYDEFRQHLTYSKFMYLVDVQIALDAYPQTNTVKVEAVAKGKSPDYVADPEVKPRRFSLKFGPDKPIVKPDLVRHEAGIPIPKTVPTSDGQVVDRLLEQATPSYLPKS